MKLKNNRYLTIITVWYVLGFIYLGLFVYNFFPVKTKSTINNVKPPEWVTSLTNYERLDIRSYKPQVDRIILIVIDALRNDFVTKTNMPYVYSEINKPEGCLLPAKAESPTVTMPRLKAMTTGSVPQFIDLILNFASTEITDDSFLHRAKEAGKKMIFYGDDTWLKLFPNMFIRSEGTTSFYVSDFTEVDNNVTRHLNRELQEKDWHIMFLHYLGLDHIGHVHGPFHYLINKKLQEMDNIIKNIHTTVRQQDNKTVILICGDHGMRDAGGHGGSSEAETLVPLIFLGVTCNSKHERQFSQTDIAPTLSALMGLPLPTDNIGKIILDIMNLTTYRQLYLLYYNSKNLVAKDDDTLWDEWIEIYHGHIEYLRNGTIDTQHLIDAYEYKITDQSKRLIKNSTVQKIPFLYISFTALIVVLMALLSIKHATFFIIISVATILFTFVPFCFEDNIYLFYVTSVYCVIILLLVSTKLLNVVKLFPKFTTSSILFFTFCGTILRTILLMSSSYIEEEEEIWYYFWGTVSTLGAIEQIKYKRWKKATLWLVLFVGLRICRHLNHTGLWASTPDIANWLQEPENNLWLIIVNIIGEMGVATSCSRLFRSDNKIKLLSFFHTVIKIFWYRAYHDKYAVFQARILMISILIVGVLSYIRYKEIFKTLSLMWMFWVSLLMRPQNVILIPICFNASQILFKLCPTNKLLLLLHVWLAYVLFHCLGICNYLSSIDVSPGYVGQTEYSLFFTSFQVICHTYTFQILSLLLLFSQKNFGEQIKMLHSVMIFRLFSVTWYCFCILLHRQHLFIWSVFSPKLLVESCHTALLFIALLCYLLINFCTRRLRLNVY